LATAVLEEEALELRDLKARILTKAYLGRGMRRLLVVPTTMLLPAAEADDLNAGRRKLRLAFTLPAGSYATLVLKSLEL
jgi:tRNA pseudouridine13 synthase